MVGTLRQQYRKLRRELSEHEQLLHATQLSDFLLKLIRQQQLEKIAIYIPNDGEISPLVTKQKLFNDTIQFYLPVLAKRAEEGLKFALWNHSTQFADNQFNIPEPVVEDEKLLDAKDCDAIFLPLVAFDREGNRMGMGGGYYDRALQRFKTKSSTDKPLLVGLAHAFQEAKALESNHWDIPMDMIATELEMISFN